MIVHSCWLIKVLHNYPLHFPVVADSYYHFHTVVQPVETHTCYLHHPLLAFKQLLVASDIIIS